EVNNRIIEALVAASQRFTHLRTLFLGDITSEESEISWISHSDVSPLFNAYPKLKYFGVRGVGGLRLGHIQHDHLRKLVIESGGLPRGIVEEILNSNLPALEHLELWLGTSDYGGDTTVEDFAPLFNGSLFPQLRYLGLRDSEIVNDLAQSIAQ